MPATSASGDGLALLDRGAPKWPPGPFDRGAPTRPPGPPTLVAQAAGISIDRIPLPSFRPPIRPLPLNVLWPTDEPPAMREDWVSWFGIPTQFSPHWEAGMAIAEPTAQTRLILSDE